MMFLPTWAYINLYAMSAWTRTIVVPLSIFSAFKPVRRLPPAQGIAELFLLPQHKKLLTHPPVIENGEFLLPTGPGWGTDVNEDELRAHAVKAHA